MSDPVRPPDTEPHLRCRNLVWEPAPDSGGVVPGRYCVSRVGVIQSMDCPVSQGCSCCLFDPRSDDESPSASGEERLDEIRGELTADYLRWSYWKRVDVLRGSEPPPEVIEPDIAEEILPEIETPPEADAEEIVRLELPPSPEKDEALKEKYPGQRRSEDRRRSRKPASEEEVLPEDDFTKGIFELPSLDPEPEVSPPSPPEDHESADAEQELSETGRRRPRRRNRRRRGKGKGSSGQKPST